MAHLYACKGSILLLILNMLGFDRDLSIAGRAMVRNGKGDIVQRLVKIDRPSMPLFAQWPLQSLTKYQSSEYVGDF